MGMDLAEHSAEAMKEEFMVEGMGAASNMELVDGVTEEAKKAGTVMAAAEKAMEEAGDGSRNKTTHPSTFMARDTTLMPMDQSTRRTIITTNTDGSNIKSMRPFYTTIINTLLLIIITPSFKRFFIVIITINT
jgi:hypothetical protein